MLKTNKTFSSFSIDNLDKAKAFYGDTLGLEPTVMEDSKVLFCETGGDTRFMAYFKEDHQPAVHTVLNFSVDDVGQAVDELKGKGIKFEPVEGTGENGVAVMGDTRAAWFKDPAGNWIGLFDGI